MSLISNNTITHHMNLITTIEEFKLKYDNTDSFIVENKLSENVLEYYVENYIVDWEYISRHQTLTESFIEKYRDNVNRLISEFLEKYNIDKLAYEFNKYE